MASSDDEKTIQARALRVLAGLPPSTFDGPRMTFRTDEQRQRLELWPLQSATNEALDRLASNLKGWGFPPDFHGPRPADETALASITEWNAGMAEWIRKKGVIWYEWPLVVHRSKDDAGGAGFDDLVDDLATHGSEISWADLAEALQTARFRNMPPDRSARSYTC